MVYEERFRSEPHPPVLQHTVVLLQGTPIGNATQGGGLAAAYDGNKDQIGLASPVGDSAEGIYNGLRLPAAYYLNEIRIWLSNPNGFESNSGQTRRCTVYGKNGQDPNSPRDGTVLRFFMVPDTAKLVMFVSGSYDVTVPYDRIWLTLDNPGGGQASVFTEIEYYGYL
jgi:hypothetical protein